MKVPQENDVQQKRGGLSCAFGADAEKGQRLRYCRDDGLDSTPRGPNLKNLYQGMI